MSSLARLAPAEGVPAIATDAEAIEAAKRFAAAIAPGASERDRRAEHPFAELELLSRSGLLGISVPRSHGGAGVGYATLAEVFRIFGQADGSLAQIPQNHFGMVDALTAVGTPEQQSFFFAEVLRGARFGNASAERSTAHAKLIETRLTPDGRGGWRVNGRKFYSTGALSADWISVLALDEAGRLVTALARNGSPGIEIVDDWSGMGQRTTASGTVTLTDVEVQPDHVIESWRIYEEPRLWTAAANLSHLALDVGIARDAFEDGLAFLRTRARPWYESGVERAVDDPLTLMRVGQLAARLHAVEEMLSDVGRLLDTTAQDTTDEGVRRASLSVARATALTNDVAVEIGSEIFAFSGASSTDEAHNLSRHWRNARTHTVHAAGRWRYHRVGDFFLNGRLPPTNRTN